MCKTGWWRLAAPSAITGRACVYGELVTGNLTHTLAYFYFDIDRRDPTGFTTEFESERKRFSYLGKRQAAWQRRSAHRMT